MGRESAAGGLRAGLLLLAALGVVGAALALAYERHWQSPWQLAPWVTLGIVSIAWVAFVVRQTAATVWLARAVAVLAIVSAALGAWQHVEANLSGDHAAHDHAAGPETMASDDHHAANGDSSASDGHDHSHNGDSSDDDGHSHNGDSSDDDHHASDPEPETMSDDVSLVDALTGSAGHAPVPAALTIAPIGLALALATIGLGGARRRSRG